MAESIKLPALGMNMEEATFLDWKKKVGESVRKGEIVAEVEADKATIEIEASTDGVLAQTFVKPGDTVKVGMDIAKLGTVGEVVAVPVTPPPPAAPAPAPVPPPIAVDAHAPGGVRASPIARRIADEKGIDLRQVHGSGPNGRIVKADVERFTPAAAPAAQAAPVPAVPMTAAPASAPVPAYTPAPAPAGADFVEAPDTRMCQRIAQRTTESKQHTPHFYLTAEVDMAPAMALRKQINEGLPEAQKVTVNDLIVKAVALALRKFPNLNSHYYGDRLVRHQRINIGIAVALEKGGLLNVVARDADIISISRLAQRNKELINNARTGKVRPEDLEGSTFTVSNLGPYDIEHFEAIINPPEAGILAVASARQVPVVVNGEIAIGTRMKCTLSVDHRVSDGAEGAQFLQEVRGLLEMPMRLLV